MTKRQKNHQALVIYQAAVWNISVSLQRTKAEELEEIDLYLSVKQNITF